jgi:Restriction endonuclease
VNGAEASGADGEIEENDEPAASGMSAAARAAALAETGVLEGDDDDVATEAGREELMSQGDDAREGAAAMAGEELDDEPAAPAAGDIDGGAEGDADAAQGGQGGDDGQGDEDGEGDDEELGAEGAAAPGGELARGGDELGPGRRRRRRRRRRGGEGLPDGAPRTAEAGVEATGPGEAGASAPAGDEVRPSDGALEGEGQGPRRIMTPVDAAIEILRGQAPGLGVHVRRIAEAAARRRLVHGEPNEAWRVMRAALAAEPRERLRAGLRPRVRSAGAGLFSLARRPPDAELERAELVFGEARRALRERTVAALERRIAELPAPAFEALARVLLQREGFGPATFVKRVEGTIYVEALRGRGSRPSKALVALRAGGSSAGRRSIGELRAGIRARSQEEGLLMLGGRLAEEAITEWKLDGQPIEIADGQAMAETCLRHGLGVINANVSVDFVDADFFADLAEG